MKTTTLIAIVLFSLLSISRLNAQTTWHDDPLNPHLRNIGRVLSPSVLFDSSSHSFHLWGTDGHNLYRALSLDGSTWYISEYDSPYLASVFSMNFLFAVEVVRVDSMYYMYFTGQQFNGKLIIGLATSRDGDNWTLHPSSPVLRATGVTWESGGVAYAKIVHTAQGFIMAYTGGDGKTASMVGIATSQDGILWQRFGGNPVILPKDSVSGIAPCALASKDGQFYLLYNSLVAPADWINLAVSSDGFHWTKSGSNPVVRSGAPGSWNSGSLGEGTLRFVGSGAHFWYSALSNDQSLWQMGHAWTDSLGSDTLGRITNTKTDDPEDPKRFLLNQNLPNPFNPSTTISFQVPAAALVNLGIYDVLGQRVATLTNGEMKPGRHERTFDATGLATIASRPVYGVKGEITHVIYF